MKKIKVVAYSTVQFTEVEKNLILTLLWINWKNSARKGLNKVVRRAERAIEEITYDDRVVFEETYYMAEQGDEYYEMLGI